MAVVHGKTKRAKQDRQRDQRIKGHFKHLDGKAPNVSWAKGNKVSRGLVKNWEAFLHDLKHKQVEPHSTFHQVIHKESKVKPYFIVTTKSESREQVTLVIVKTCIKLFLEQWEISLKEDAFKVQYNQTGLDEFQTMICIATACSTGTTWFFETQKHAKWFCQLVENDIKDTYPFAFVVDQYEANKQIDLVGKYSGRETKTDNVNDRPVDFIVSDIPEPSSVLAAPEPISMVKDIDIMKEEWSPNTLKFILGLIPHPSLDRNSLHFEGGFYTINYSNREEKCVSSGSHHQEAGICFFAQEGVVKMACMHAQCVDDKDRKIVVPICLLSEKRITFSYMRPQFCLLSTGVGEIAKALVKGIVKYAPKKFYILENGIWVPDQNKSQMRLLVNSELRQVYSQFENAYSPKDQYEQICTLTRDERNDFKKQYRDILNHVSIPKVLNQLQIVDLEFEGKLDHHPGYLAAKNGLVCLKTKSLLRFTADSMVTKCLKTKYHPDAVCDLWESSVRDMFRNDEELYDYVRWIIGYALHGNPKQRLLIVLYGEKGGNGKSLLMGVIRKVINEYACTLDENVFRSKTPGKASPHLVALRNRRIGYISDSNRDMEFQGGPLKQLTGGSMECLSVRKNYGAQTDMLLTVVPFICTNHILEFPLDPAFESRLVVIPFENEYVKGQPTESYQRTSVEGLEDAFAADEAQEGILAWLVDCGKYYHDNPNKKPTEKMEQYKQIFIAEQEE